MMFIAAKRSYATYTNRDQQRKKKMVSTLNLGQPVDRHFDALSSKYERAEIRKLFASGITLIAGGLIKINHEHLKCQQPRDTGIVGTITLNFTL